MATASNKTLETLPSFFNMRYTTPISSKKNKVIPTPPPPPLNCFFNVKKKKKKKKKRRTILALPKTILKGEGGETVLHSFKYE